MRLSLDYINKFIAKKSDWIVTKQLQMKKRRELLDERLLGSSGAALFLGEKNVPNFSSKKELILWYKREAAKYLVPRVEFYAGLLGVGFGKIKIGSAKKRWGSCSARGNINFSWRLIMAPKEAVDYVVAHEVAHLLHKNHSAKFWNCVLQLMPDYKQHHVWLRRNGFLLDL